MKRRFTLLEVVIALAILATGMMVLIDTQAIAVVMTSEAERIRIGTLLAEEKMAEVQILVETDGFTDSDIEEEGDFKDFGEEEFRAEVGDIDLATELGDYKWAYTIREIELTVPDDLTGTATELIGDGYLGEDVKESYESSEVDTDSLDLTDLGIDTDQITDLLSAYIKEVRVLVWWSDEVDDEGNYTDSVEFVTHVVNPTGLVVSSDDSEEAEDTEGE